MQGQSKNEGEMLIEDAKKLEDSGVFALVLEMIPAEIAKTITETLSIPTIGIGAGKYTSGQILVLQDLLGLTKNFNPKFLKKYFDGYSKMQSSLNEYNQEVKNNIFPSDKESYS